MSEILSVSQALTNLAHAVHNDDARAYDKYAAAIEAEVAALRSEIERLRSALAAAGEVIDPCDEFADRMDRAEAEVRTLTGERDRLREQIAEERRRREEAEALLRVVAAEGCRDEAGSGVSCREAAIPPADVCEVCQVIEWLAHRPATAQPAPLPEAVRLHERLWEVYGDLPRSVQGLLQDYKRALSSPPPPARPEMPEAVREAAEAFRLEMEEAYWIDDIEHFGIRDTGAKLLSAIAALGGAR